MIGLGPFVSVDLACLGQMEGYGSTNDEIGIDRDPGLDSAARGHGLIQG